MYLLDFVDVYDSRYQGTAVMDRTVSILTFENNNPLWEGTIAELCADVKKRYISGEWEIVEQIVDYSRSEECCFPVWNKSKILKVI